MYQKRSFHFAVWSSLTQYSSVKNNKKTQLLFIRFLNLIFETIQKSNMVNKPKI